MSSIPAEVASVLDDYAADRTPEKAAEKQAVKAALAALAVKAPGRSVEVRVPPHAAIQVVEGSSHRRGTPSAVVETDARTLLALASGRLSWSEAVATGALRASGHRSDLSTLFPLFASP